MVIKTITTFEIPDIISIRIKCLGCQGDIVYSVNTSRFDVPEHCPQCHEEWYDKHHNQQPVELMLMNDIRRLMNFNNSGTAQGQPTFKLQFEMSTGGDDNNKKD